MATEFWTNQSPRTKVIIAGSVLLAAVVFIFIIGLSGGSGSYTLLSTNLDATTSAKIITALKGANIPYQVADAGQTIDVSSSRINDARALLASNNLVNGGHVGWSLCNKTSLGQTDFQQKLLYQQCLQDAIALSLQQIDGIQEATVNLAIPQTQTPFTSEQQPTTASVLLNLGGATLTSDQVKGIAELVSSGVPGLNANSVTITDENGNLLWGGGANGATGVSGSDTKLTMERNYDQQTAAQVESMLSQVLGPGKAVVQVNADLNFDSKQIQQETWGNTERPLTKQTTNETYKGNGSPPSGAAGTASNTATGYAVGTNGSSANNYKNTTTNVTNAIDKTITTTNVAPGTVQRQTVSVLVDSSVPAATLPNIQQSVQSAVGYNQTRGDVVTVQSVKFAAPTTTAAPAKGTIPGNLVSMIKMAALLLAALFVLIFLYRRATRQTKQVLTIAGGDMPGRQRQAIAGGDQVTEALTSGTAELAREAAARDAVKKQAIDAASGNPQESGMILQKWLGDN